MERRFLLYGRGNGRGHATRVGALCYSLERLGCDTKLIVDAAAYGVALGMGVAPNRVIPVVAEHAAQTWAEALATFAPTDVIVDTFPEGLNRELRPWHFPRARWVALLRCRQDPGDRLFLQALEGYSALYDLEPELNWSPPRSVPFGAVIREISRGSERCTSPTDVILIATESRHQTFLEKLGHSLRELGVKVRRYPPQCASRFDAPLLTLDELCAKVAVGPAGYNLTYELASLGVWHLALPVPRQYDCQQLRATCVAVTAQSPTAVQRRVLAWLEHGGQRPAIRCRPVVELAIELTRTFAPHRA